MIDTKGTLNYLESLSNTILRDSAAFNLRNDISYVRNKADDPNLYLALVGEFSSGKSTFINALIGYRILKEAVRPTTACATYIRRGGECLTAKIEFFDGREFVATSKNYSAITSYLYKQFNKELISFQGIIDCVTSDQKIAQTVSALEIIIPNARIPENIVLIDTPGFNPGENSVSNHYEITKKVVEKIADAALILTPQEQAMSAELVRFIQNNLRRFLHRCVFVVTRMDRAFPESRQSIMEYVRNQIQVHFNINRPQLYAECAITMLPVRMIPLELKEDWIYFQEEFKRFQREIWNFLQTNKTIVLKEHVNLLVNDVVGYCKQNIQWRECEIRKDKEFLDSHDIANIKQVCSLMVSQSSTAIYASLNKINNSTSKAEENSKKKIKDLLYKNPITSEAFETNLQQQINRIVEDEARKWLASVSDRLNREVKSCVKVEIEHMQKIFASHYNNFPALKPCEKAPSIEFVHFNFPNLSFSLVMSQIKGNDTKHGVALGIGAIAGALLGFCIGGPAGAATGAYFGGKGGMEIFDDNSEVVSSITTTIDREVASLFSKLAINVDNEKNRVVSRYMSLIQRFADNHVQMYGSAVNELIMKRDEQMCFMNNQIKSLKSTLINLNSIQDEIEEELSFLKFK